MGGKFIIFLMCVILVVGLVWLVLIFYRNKNKKLTGNTCTIPDAIVRIYEPVGLEGDYNDVHCIAEFGICLTDILENKCKFGRDPRLLFGFEKINRDHNPLAMLGIRKYYFGYVGFVHAGIGRDDQGYFVTDLSRVNGIRLCGDSEKRKNIDITESITSFMIADVKVDFINYSLPGLPRYNGITEEDEEKNSQLNEKSRIDDVIVRRGE